MENADHLHVQRRSKSRMWFQKLSECVRLTHFGHGGDLDAANKMMTCRDSLPQNLYPITAVAPVVHCQKVGTASAAIRDRPPSGFLAFALRVPH